MKTNKQYQRQRAFWDKADAIALLLAAGLMVATILKCLLSR